MRILYQLIKIRASSRRSIENGDQMKQTNIFPLKADPSDWIS